MFLLVKLAWRNSLRNRKRTFLAALAIGAGLATLIFSDALLKGLSEAMIRTATDTFLGQAQITYRGFRDTHEVEKTIVGATSILDELKREKDVAGYAPRAVSVAMITSPLNTSSVLLYGIEPELEKGVSQIDNVIIKGSYLASENMDGILIGKSLADTLEAGLGDRVVITVAQEGSGDLSQEMFRISGIFYFNMREMDGGMAFVNLGKCKEMLALNERIHEIAVNFTDINIADHKSLDFWKKYSQNGNKAMSWREIMPELSTVLRLSDFSILIIGIILFGVVVLGILNTLFMSLYERTFEFGVLRAIGTRSSKMAIMILVETSVLALISIAVGAIIGLAASLYFSTYGINYAGIEYAGITFRKSIIPAIEASQYYKYPIYLFVFTVLVGLYPAIHAARMKPVKVMRRSL